ncbi:MAG: carbohydrate kinase [Candidatus Izimaplasma sp.]|nr:carbohydrate kinase [Candidatus Izimaplasma bacterium]
MNNIIQFHDKKYDILVIGETLIDTIKDQTTTKKYFGGSPANITINLTRLGCHPMLVSSLGNDTNGTFLKSRLTQEGINLSFIRRVEHPTSKVILNQTVGSPEPIFMRGSDHFLYYTSELDKHLINSKILHFSYWPLSKNPAKNTVLKAIQTAKKNNVLVGFDPNFHKDLLEEGSLSFEELLEIIKQVDILKPSLDDAKRIFKEGLSIDEYVKKFEALGVGLVVMTLGKDGLIAAYQGELVRLPSYATKVVDATGAGDAFWSGLYGGILNNYTVYQSIQLGLACSAYSLQFVGAISNLPKLTDLAKEYSIIK